MLRYQGIAFGVNRPLTGRLVHPPAYDGSVGRGSWAVVSSQQDDASGILCASLLPFGSAGGAMPCVEGDWTALREGDVVELFPSGTVHVLLQRGGSDNALFVTSFCNSRCEMCPQPTEADDITHARARLLGLVNLAAPDTEHLGLTGGEPALLGTALVDVIRHCREVLPSTGLHLLTNGRLLDGPLVRQLARVAHPDLTVAIPLHSALDSVHDAVSGVSGAYDETICGLYRLAEAGLRVELRVVVMKSNCRELDELAYFVYRNLTFVAQVVFVGLEMTGMALQNRERVWVDPADYVEQLEAACSLLVGARVPVSIYGHQLCVLPESVRSLGRDAISGWKRVFVNGCGGCALRSTCGGFFGSNVPRFVSRSVKAVAAAN